MTNIQELKDRQKHLLTALRDINYVLDRADVVPELLSPQFFEALADGVYDIPAESTREETADALVQQHERQYEEYSLSRLDNLRDLNMLNRLMENLRRVSLRHQEDELETRSANSPCFVLRREFHDVCETLDVKLHSFGESIGHQYVTLVKESAISLDELTDMVRQSPIYAFFTKSQVALDIGMPDHILERLQEEGSFYSVQCCHALVDRQYHMIKAELGQYAYWQAAGLGDPSDDIEKKRPLLNMFFENACLYLKGAEDLMKDLEQKNIVRSELIRVLGEPRRALH